MKCKVLIAKLKATIRTKVKPTVLLVNDDQDLRAILEMLLSNEGYIVLPAACNAETIALLHDEKIDLVIQDILRPGASGFELYWILRNEESLSRIPMMIVSGWRNLNVERLSWFRRGPNNRYRLTFISESSQACEAVIAVQGIDNPNILCVGGYLQLPMALDAFLPVVKGILK